MDPLQNGLIIDGQQNPLLEGQKDHKVLLKQCGIFRAMEKMIGHSLLNGGPAVYGTSPAIFNYWTSCLDESHYQYPMHESLEDVAGVELHLYTRNTCTQKPLARLPNLFSVMLRPHTAINRADFVSW